MRIKGFLNDSVKFHSSSINVRKDTIQSVDLAHKNLINILNNYYLNDFVC